MDKKEKDPRLDAQEKAYFDDVQRVKLEHQRKLDALNAAFYEDRAKLLETIKAENVTPQPEGGGE